MPASSRGAGALIAFAADRLAAAGVPEPRLEASLLLAHVLRGTRACLLAHPDALVPPDAIARFERLLARRVDREPYAYLIGEREFYGRLFKVDRRALIPRPETELLVDAARERAGALPARPLAIDVGTGSGCLAITLALELPGAHLVAGDISTEALQLAAENVERFGLQKRVRLVRGDLLSWLGQRPDLVVANLPYIPDETMAELPDEVRLYEPERALRGGPGGATLIRPLLRQAAALEAGLVLAEVDARHAEAVLADARRGLPDYRARLQPDLSGRPRLLILERS